MPSSQFTRHILHPANELLEMVADVESYPEFINLISALRVTKRISESRYEAEAIISYKMLREVFKSNIDVDREAMTISVTKAEKGGAVKTLQNNWKFHSLSDGSTLIDFYVDVSLKAFPLNILIREKMDKATDVIMGAFEARAVQVCSKAGSTSVDLAAEKARLNLA